MPGGEEPQKIDHDHRVRINLALSSGISSRTSPLPFIRFPQQKRSFTGYGKKPARYPSHGHNGIDEHGVSDERVVQRLVEGYGEIIKKVF
jgi:hypothetical protein